MFAHGLHILLGNLTEGMLDESFGIDLLVGHQHLKLLGFKFLLDLIKY